MERIKADIKQNKYSKAYLLYGDQDYLKNGLKKMLVEAIIGDNTMNMSAYTAENFNIGTLLDDSRTLPFFADYRLILVEDSGVFKSASEELADIIKNAADTTIFLFVESSIDKRNKAYKEVSKNGYVREYSKDSAELITSWVDKHFKAAQKQIDRKTINYLLTQTGNDMYAIKNEVDKLIAYVGDSSNVTIADIEEICIKPIEDKVFDMITAMSYGNRDAVFRLYGDLIALKEAPLKILVLIGRHFSTLHMVCAMLEEGHKRDAIKGKLGQKAYFVDRYMEQAKNFSRKKLKSAIEECVRADHDIKSGLMEDTYAVELIMMKYCEVKNNG